MKNVLRLLDLSYGPMYGPMNGPVDQKTTQRDELNSLSVAKVHVGAVDSVGVFPHLFQLFRRGESAETRDQGRVFTHTHARFSRST